MQSENSNRNQRNSRDYAALYREAMAMRRRGQTKASIARSLGVCRKTINRWIPPRATHRWRGIPRPPGRPAIITPELLVYLEQMRQNGADMDPLSWEEIPADWIRKTAKEHCRRRRISRESIRRIRLSLVSRNPPEC